MFAEVILARGCGNGPGIGCQSEGEVYHCYCGTDLCNRRLAKVLRSAATAGPILAQTGPNHHLLIAVCLALAWTLVMLSKTPSTYF